MTSRDVWFSGSGIPWWALLLALLLVAGMVRWHYRRITEHEAGFRLWWFRFLAIALTLVALVDLTWRPTEVPMPDLMVAVDVSASGDLPNSSDPDTISRLQAVRDILADRDEWEAISEKFDVHFFLLANQAVRSQNPLDDIREGQISERVGDRNDSQLGEAIERLIEQPIAPNTAAIVLFSDGATTGQISLAEAGRIAGRSAVPVFAIGTGGDRPPPNLAVSDIRVNRRVRVGVPFQVDVPLRAESLAGASFVVQLSDDSSGTVLASDSFSTESADQLIRWQPSITFESPGSRRIRASINPLPEEVDQNDNQQEIDVRAVTGLPRVLLVDRLPRPAFRFQKQSLVRAVNPQTDQKLFDVKTYLQSASPGLELIEETALRSFPDAETLMDFDVVIVGDIQFDSVGGAGQLPESDKQTLLEYVKNQTGNLIFVPGRSALTTFMSDEDLATLLPVKAPTGSVDLNASDSDRRDFRLQVTGLASQFPPMNHLIRYLESTTFASFAAMGQFDLKPAALELASFVEIGQSEIQATPAICLQRIGTGMVVTHLTDELYRLRYRNPDTVYKDYWTQWVSYLANSRLQKRDRVAVLNTDARRYAPTQPVEIMVEIYDPTMLDNPPNQIPVVVSRDNRGSRTVELNHDASLTDHERYTNRLFGLSTGVYRVRLAAQIVGEAPSIETTFTVANSAAEFAVKRRQTEALQALAENSGGMFLPVGQFDQLGSQLPRSAPAAGEWGRPTPLWSWPGVPIVFAAAVLGLLVVEWVLRRRINLE